MKLKILILAPYPPQQVASQRFRFEQYMSELRKRYDCTMHSFYSFRTFSILYKKGHFTEKLVGFLGGYIRVVYILLNVHKFDLVFLHREATPLGPPWVEWVIAKVFKKPLIYDFDDAIWMPVSGDLRRGLLGKLRYPKKFNRICKWSSKISCGNRFLAQYASQFNHKVAVIPTTIDTRNYHIPKASGNNQLTIGWTGSHSTLPYLTPIIPLLQKLQAQYNLVFKVICNLEPDFEMPGLEYVKWTQKDEIDVLNSIDIGIMPLPDTDWARGKCGFKILQYMALEKPAVASAIGVNNDIIDHGQNGLLCYQHSDWLKNLESLITDIRLRDKLGINGRIAVERHYSKSAIMPSFLGLFE